MKTQALGIIETQSLVASIAALDEMAKAADVRILGKDHPGNRRSTITIVGEVAAVRSAVDAGVTAAEKVGTVMGCHIIARPDPSIDCTIKKVGKTKLLEHDASDTLLPKRGKQQGKKVSGKKTAHSESVEFEKMTVTQLRKLARSTPGLSIKGREISRADKNTLIEHLSKSKSSKK